MKKVDVIRWIAMVVCLATVLAACGDPKPTEAPTVAPTAAPTAAPTDAPTAAPTSAPTEAPTAVPTEAPTIAPTASPTEPPTEAPTAPAVTFEDVDETVYVLANLRVRSGPGTEYEQIGLLEKDEAAKRTGIGSNGWSRILYNSEVAYVHSDYVTTVTFEDVEETVYATTAVNVRSGPGTEYDRIGLLATDDSVRRTGIGSNGWSRVVYNGEIGYVSSEFLTTKAPETESFNPDLLVGDWAGAYRMESYADFLVVREIRFNRDGTGYLIAYEYHYMALEEGAEKGWNLAGMGYQGQEFTYELLGNELYFHFLGYETDYGDYMEPYTKVYEVYQLDDTWMVMSDSSFGTYFRGADTPIGELCEALGVDDTPPEARE